MTGGAFGLGSGFMFGGIAGTIGFLIMNSCYYDINFDRVGFAIGIIGASVAAGMAGAAIGMIYQNYAAAKELRDFFTPRTENIDPLNNIEPGDGINIQDNGFNIISDNNNINLNNNFNPQNLNLREINNFNRVTGVNLNDLVNPGDIDKAVCKNLYKRIVDHISQNSEFSLSKGVSKINTNPITKLNKLLINKEVVAWSKVYDSMVNVAIDYYENYVSNNLQRNPFYNRISNINQNNDIINTNNNINNINLCLPIIFINKNGLILETTNIEYCIRQALYEEYLKINNEIQSFESNTINNINNDMFGINDNNLEIRNQFLDINVSVGDLESTVDQLRHQLEALRIRNDYYGNIFRSNQRNIGIFEDPFALLHHQELMHFIFKHGNPYDYCFNLPYIFKKLDTSDKKILLFKDLNFIKHLIDKNLFNKIKNNIGKKFVTRGVHEGDYLTNHDFNAEFNPMNINNGFLSSFSDNDCDEIYYMIFKMLAGKRDNNKILKEQNRIIFNTLKSSYIPDIAINYFNDLTQADKKFVFNYFLEKCKKLINIVGNATLKKDYLIITSRYNDDLELNILNNESFFKDLYGLYHTLAYDQGYLYLSNFNLKYEHLSNDEMFELIVKYLPVIYKDNRQSQIDYNGRDWFDIRPVLVFDLSQMLFILNKWNNELDDDKKSELFKFMLDFIQKEVKVTEHRYSYLQFMCNKIIKYSNQNDTDLIGNIKHKHDGKDTKKPRDDTMWTKNNTNLNNNNIKHDEEDNKYSNINSDENDDNQKNINQNDDINTNININNIISEKKMMIQK